MGRHWKSNGWSKFGKAKKSWGEKSWKKKWAKTCERDEREDRKDLDKKVKCDFDLKIKKWAWDGDDGFGCGGWKSKFKFKHCNVDLKNKKWGCDWEPKDGRDDNDDFCDGRDDDYDRGQIKFRDCKIKWKGCEIESPVNCDSPILCEQDVIEEVVCDYPTEPAANNAPTIIAPTERQILIDDSANNNIVSKVVAEDLDGDSLVFSINDATDPDSADAEFFTIDSQSGEILMTEAPGPWGSVDGDSIYQIEVEVSDGQATDSIILDLLYVTSA